MWELLRKLRLSTTQLLSCCHRRVKGDAYTEVAASPSQAENAPVLSENQNTSQDRLISNTQHCARSPNIQAGSQQTSAGSGGLGDTTRPSLVSGDPSSDTSASSVVAIVTENEVGGGMSDTADIPGSNHGPPVPLHGGNTNPDTLGLSRSRSSHRQPRTKELITASDEPSGLEAPESAEPSTPGHSRRLSRPQVVLQSPDHESDKSPGSVIPSEHFDDSQGGHSSPIGDGSTARGSPGTSDIGLGDLLPLEIIFEFSISVDNARYSQKSESFGWYLGEESYADMIARVQSATLPGHKDADNRTSYFRYGACRVRGDRNETSFANFDRDDVAELREKAIVAITGFISTFPYEPFSVEVKLDYSFIRIPPNDPQHQNGFREIMVAELERKMIKVDKDQKEYISRIDIRQFSTEDIIERHIRTDESLAGLQWDSMNRKEFAREIFLDARSLYAACLFSSVPLRLLYHLLHCNPPYNDVERPTPENHNHCREEHCFHRLKRLYRASHGFFARTIDSNGIFERIDDTMILPIRYQRTIDKSGAHGDVFEVYIDPTHHYLSGDRNCPFALKVFKEGRSRAMDAAEREQKMLEELANFPHPHIVPHLAGWTQNEKFHILYPLAKCNLRAYMRNRKRPSLTANEVRWFLTQLRGLADALRHLHTLGAPTVHASSFLAPKEPSSALTTTQLVGVHHDIKPENILVFPSPKGQDTILKIGDFGAGKVGSQPQGLRSHLATGDRGTLTYEGPDKKFNESRDRGTGVSRPFDVWALACVFLELLSWLFMDYEEGVDAFASNRPYISDNNVLETDCFWYEPTKGDYVLRPHVEERLEVLENLHCKGAFKDLLVLIRKMFVIDPRLRITALALYGGLDAIVKQAMHDLEKDEHLYTNVNTPPPKMVYPDARSNGPSRKISARNLRRSDLDPGSPSPVRSSPREDLVESGSGAEATFQGHLPGPSAPESGQVEIVLDDNRVASTTTDSSSHLGLLQRTKPAEREGRVADIAAAFQNAASGGSNSQISFENDASATPYRPLVNDSDEN